MPKQRAHIAVSWVLASGILAVLASNAWINLSPFERAFPAVQSPDVVAVDDLAVVADTDACTLMDLELGVRQASTSMATCPPAGDLLQPEVALGEDAVVLDLRDDGDMQGFVAR